MPYRTSDLCRVKALKRILVRPTASANYAILQVFYEIRCGNSSISYALVPARLQYGCSNFPVSKGESEHRIRARFLRVTGRHCRSR
jgi:hypothetical protein